MKHLIITISILLLSIFGIEAQPPQSSQTDQIKQDFHTLQCRIIEKNLSLEGEKLELFREIYNQYTQELAVLAESDPQPRQGGGQQGGGQQGGGRGGQQGGQGGERGEKLTDQEIEQNILDSFSRSRRSIEIKETYYKKFRTILSPSQINQMYRVERMTRERFSSELNKRQGGGAGGGAQQGAQ